MDSRTLADSESESSGQVIEDCHRCPLRQLGFLHRHDGSWRRRCREKQAAHGRTFAELLQRVGGDPARLRLILDQEVERGVVDYHSTSRRYSMNGHLPDDTKIALRDLAL
jgi:hypothetical protein